MNKKPTSKKIKIQVTQTTKNNTQLRNKVCIITGATSGIGKAAALKIAAAGLTLGLIGRNKDKLAQTTQEIKTTNKNAIIHTFQADLSSIKQIRVLAKAIHKQFDKIDILINNAGAIFLKREMTIDGYEKTFALNHLAYFLLTNELLPLLKKSPTARIINVSSTAHKSGRINVQDIMMEKQYNGFFAYANSKLANVLFTYELARRLANTNIRVNCLHPGVIATEFSKNNNGLIPFLVKAIKPFILTPEEGAKTTIYLALSEEVQNTTGKYFVKCKSVRSSSLSYNAQIGKKLWELSEQMISDVLKKDKTKELRKPI